LKITILDFLGVEIHSRYKGIMLYHFSIKSILKIFIV
jgi:hypothetical protein